jgi:methylmalonyl-CoA/ethylmalonyl-CoA epimerase
VGGFATPRVIPAQAGIHRYNGCKLKEMFKGLSHVAIAVPDLAAAKDRLARTYGLTAGETYENEEQGVRLAYVELGNTRIELIEPLTSEGPIAAFIEKHPAGGLHHVSLYVDDVPQALDALATRDVSLIGGGRIGKNAHGRAIAFVHPKSFLGTLLEVEEAPPPEKGL